MGRDACGLGRPGGPVWRGVGAPPYGPGQTCAVGAASSRPKRPPFPAVPPRNGRRAACPHAAMATGARNTAPGPGGSAPTRNGRRRGMRSRTATKPRLGTPPWGRLLAAPTTGSPVGPCVGLAVPAARFGGVWAPRPTDRRPGPLTQKRRVPLGTRRLGKQAYSTTLVINP